jgi:hypothetical protein
MKKFIKLDTTATVTSRYNGALAGDILGEALVKSDTINKGLITMLPNILGTGALPKLSHSNSFAAYDCAFTPSGTQSYTDKALVTKRFRLDSEHCKGDYRNMFQTELAGDYGNSQGIPATVQEAILVQILADFGKNLDYNIWQGTNTATEFNGFIPQMVADTQVIDVVGTAITPANVIAELTKVYSTIPEAIMLEDDLVIVVSPNVERAYKLAQAATTGGLFMVGDKEMDFVGIKLESVAGLPSNTMVAYRIKNLAFGTGLESDLNEVKLTDLSDYSNNDIVQATISFNGGVAYYYGAEIVLYKTA